jgi:hypothetical protein
MFASRWPQAMPFAPNWVTHSEVVRAVADSPVGPYTFAEVVLPARGGEFWDGHMTHNPTILKYRDRYLLFYTGTRYDRPEEARGNQRIGLATAPSVTGPWTRRNAPILSPRPGKWDAFLTTNPAPCLAPDNSILLVYKSAASNTDLLRLGVAAAAGPEATFERLVDGPIFQFGDESGKANWRQDKHIEDPFIWWSGSRYEVLMKDMNGAIGGELGGGIHGWSRDGINWRLSEPPAAYSRTVKFADGSTRTFSHVERPQLLIEDGRPRCLFVAVGLGGTDGAHRTITQSWNLAIPIEL